jgi:hypothetical protein
MQVLIYKVDDIGRVRSSLKPTSVSSTTTNRSQRHSSSGGRSCTARSPPLPSTVKFDIATQKPIVGGVVEGILPIASVHYCESFPRPFRWQLIHVPLPAPPFTSSPAMRTKSDYACFAYGVYNLKRLPLAPRQLTHSRMLPPSRSRIVSRHHRHPASARSADDRC